MLLDARWDAVFGDEVFLEALDSEDVTLRIDWGDGNIDKVRSHNPPEDGHYVYDKTHFYGQGTFDVSVIEFHTGLPAINLRAYIYSEATADLAISGTDLQEVAIGGSGNDTMMLAGGSDFVLSGAGNDHIEGGAGSDFVDGAAGDDILKGGSGDDTLGGDDGDDHIQGGAGNDLISGNEGADHLSGDRGADIFQFYFLSDIDTRGDDKILDFSGTSGDGDKLDLTNIADFTFIGAAAFDGQGPELRQVAGRGAHDHVIQGDADGDGTMDFSFKVHGDAVTAQDFVAPPGQAMLSASPALHNAGPSPHPAFADHLAMHMAVA